MQILARQVSCTTKPKLQATLRHCSSVTCFARPASSSGTAFSADDAHAGANDNADNNDAVDTATSLDAAATAPKARLRGTDRPSTQHSSQPVHNLCLELTPVRIPGDGHCVADP